MTATSCFWPLGSSTEAIHLIFVPCSRAHWQCSLGEVRGSLINERKNNRKQVRENLKTMWLRKRTIEITVETGKQICCAFKARNQFELLMLEGRRVECSRWKTLWKITYYAQFKKWLKSFTVLFLFHDPPPLSLSISLFLSLHLSKKRDSNKILFTALNLFISTVQIAALLFPFACSPARLLLSRTLKRALIYLLSGQNTYFCPDGLMGGLSAVWRDQRVC